MRVDFESFVMSKPVADAIGKLGWMESTCKDGGVLASLSEREQTRATDIHVLSSRPEKLESRSSAEACAAARCPCTVAKGTRWRRGGRTSQSSGLRQRLQRDDVRRRTFGLQIGSSQTPVPVLKRSRLCSLSFCIDAVRPGPTYPGSSPLCL